MPADPRECRGVHPDEIERRTSDGPPAQAEASEELNVPDGSTDAGTLRQSAALVLAGAVLSGPAAMAIVQLVAPQPSWDGVDTFIDHYHPVQALPYVLGYLLLGGFVLFSASCHAVAGPKLRVRCSQRPAWRHSPSGTC